MPDLLAYSANINHAQSYRLPELWSNLHLSIVSWECGDPKRFNGENEAAATDRVFNLLKCLVDTPSENWLLICRGAGMTVFGAVALSWCEGATLPQVFDGWRASGFPLKPLPEYERPARFINPALLPQTRKLSEFATAAEPDILALCAMIAHSPEPLEFDVSHPSLRGSPNPQVVAFLKSRMLQKPSRTQEEEDLIAAWSETVKGSEFDVWEGA